MTYHEHVERRRMTLLASLPVRRDRRRAADPARDSDRTLTRRQIEVLQALARGLANKEIAAELGISADGVKRTISRMLEQLGVPSRAALVEIALRTAAARADRERLPKALTLLEAVPIPAAVTRGPEHRLQMTNVAWRLACGVAPLGEGALLSGVLSERSATALIRLADEAYSSGHERMLSETPFRDRIPDAAWRYVDVFIRPLQDGAGEVAGLTLFLVDASARVDLTRSSTMRA